MTEYNVECPNCGEIADRKEEIEDWSNGTTISCKTGYTCIRERVETFLEVYYHE